MENISPEVRSIVIEGGDQVGKGTAIENLVERLGERGVESLVLSFPNYGTPIGAAIRKFQASGYFENETELNLSEIMVTKMALYALNRLEIANSLISNPQCTKPLLIWDRSAYSNAVSIGYSLFSNNISVSENTGLCVDTALEMDSFLRETFKTDDCILRLLMVGEKWKPQRGEGEDINEVADVQELSNRVYDLYRERLSEGWKDVVTKENGEWRLPLDILNDILEHASEHLNLETVDLSKPALISWVSNQKALSKLYGIENEIPFVTEFEEALRLHLRKEFYEYGMLVAEYVVKNTETMYWYNEDIKIAVRKLFQMAPALELSLNNIWGNGFGTKIINSSR